MKIMINHIKNTYNYGSAMMAINLIYYLDKNIYGKAEYCVDSEGTDNLNRILYYIKSKNIEIDNMELYKNRKVPKNKILSRIYKMLFFKTDVKYYTNYISKKYDANIILGGDDLSEYYSKIDVIKELIRIRILSKHIPVLLVGQTIGPFTYYRKNMAAYCLKDCYIYTRDDSTYKYLTHDLGLNTKNIVKSADLAFLDLPDNKIINSTDTIEKYNLLKDKYITIVPSGLVAQYTSNELDYINTWNNIINIILQNEKFNEFKIILLPHVLKPALADDRTIIKKLSKQFNDGRLVFIYDELLPHQAREILGNGLFTISARMHASVSTLQMGKPAISLSYSIKYKGVIGETLGLSGLVIECSGDKLWESNHIAEQVEDKIDYVIKNYQVLKDIIIKSVDKSKELSLAQIEHIAKKIG